MCYVCGVLTEGPGCGTGICLVPLVLPDFDQNGDGGPPPPTWTFVWVVLYPRGPRRVEVQETSSQDRRWSDGTYRVVKGHGPTSLHTPRPYASVVFGGTSETAVSSLPRYPSTPSTPRYGQGLE